MSTEHLAIQTPAELLERVVVGGDLSKLNAQDRLTYYRALCDSVRLNPLTRPFEYITLNNKLTLYAKRDATDQLRQIHGVSIEKLEREVVEGIYAVTAYARNDKGRTDSAIGAVSIEGLKGEARANAMMKAETKAKRRVTLSICGLGLLDEVEIETVPGPVVNRDEIEARDKLLVEITTIADSAGLSEDARKQLWRERCGTIKPIDATLEQLAEVLADVKKYAS